MLNKFFSLFSSNDSYRQSNISVISVANRLCNSILGAIYYKSTYCIDSITKNKVLDPEQNQSTSDATYTNEVLALTPTMTEIEDTKSDSDDETDKDDVLEQLFSECKTNFPQAYPTELRQFHQIIPEIKFARPGQPIAGLPEEKKFLKDMCAREPLSFGQKVVLYELYGCHIFWNNKQLYNDYRLIMTTVANSIIFELQKPIDTPQKLVNMAKKWLRFQEKWGENFNKIYCITGEDYPYNNYTTSKTTNYKQVIVVPQNYTSAYHITLTKIFQDPTSLKNLILILGLEYSFIHCIRGMNSQAFSNYHVPSRVNSVEHILHKQEGIPNDSEIISTTLLHLAAKQNIMSKVSFLLTNNNVNCKSYNLNFSCRRTRSGEEIVSLDTPLKIAIDNFNSANIEILLEHSADPMTVIPDKSCVYSYYNSEDITLLNYFLRKTPTKRHEITSYIEIANLLYKNLPAQEQKAFYKQAKQKMIPQKKYGILSVFFKDKEVPLSNLITLNVFQAPKSASKVGPQDIPKEEELDTSDATDKNITKSVAPTEKKDNLLATTASTNDIVQNIFSPCSGGTPSEPISDINTISLAGVVDFLPLSANLAITKS